MSKRKKKQKAKRSYIILWIVAVLFLLSSFSALPDNLSGCFACLLIAVACAFAGWRSFQAPRKAAAEVERKRAEAAERQRLFNEKHGKLYCTVAGVTFDNDDGSSRQRILKGIVNDPDEDGEVTLERYEYKGSPAIYVLYDGRCIGNIRRSDVQSVLLVMDKIESIELEAESFRNDDNEKLYRADVVIQYAKS